MNPPIARTMPLDVESMCTPCTWFLKGWQLIEGESTLKQFQLLQKGVLKRHCSGNVGATILSLTRSDGEVMKRALTNVIRVSKRWLLP